MGKKHMFSVCLLMLVTVSLYSTEKCEDICNSELLPNHLTSTVDKVTFDLKTLSTTVLVLKSSYINESFVDFVNNAELVIRQRDTFVTMLTIMDITSCTANFTIHLDTITEDLRLMSHNVLVSGHNVHDILSRFQLSDIQHKITESIKELSSCNSRLISFLQNPRSLDRTLQIVNCYDNIKFMRTIGEVLTNNTDKPLSNPLFGAIINQAGYCNGSELLTVFHYLLGAYVEGCVTMVIAETVKYNTTYSEVRDTCISTLNDALQMRVNLFEECRKEACTNIEANVQALAENKDIEIFGDQLKKMYPWFHFVVLRFIKDSKPDVKLIGNTLNSLTIQENVDDNGLQMIVWASRRSNYHSNDAKLYKYGIEFELAPLDSQFNDINMKVDLYSSSSSRERLIGYVEYPERFRCHNTVTTPPKDTSCSPLSCTVPVPYYGFIICGILFIVVILGLVLFFNRKYCMKKRKVLKLKP